MSHRCSARPALFLSALALLAALPLPIAQGEALVPTRLAPEELRWVTNPATGTQQAVMAGNQKDQGLYMYRTRFPAGYRNQPHFHPDQRIVTVMSGTLYVGYGEKMDDSQMKALPAGSIFTEPPRQPHYVWAKDGEVVIQVTGYGPSGTTVIGQK
jgi:quercetin dioxygenase-like cupin family protein